MAAEEAVRKVLDTVEDVVHDIYVVTEIRHPVIRNRIDLLSLMLLDGQVSFVVKHLKRGIYGSRARPVVTFGFLLEGLHHLIPMHRALRDQSKNHELEIPSLEDLPFHVAPAAPAAGSENE